MARDGAAAEGNRVLDADAVGQFLSTGYTIARGVLPSRLVAHVREATWKQLRDDYGVQEDDPSTWLAQGEGQQSGYFRTGGSLIADFADEARRAWEAIAEAVGGAERVDHPTVTDAGLQWSTGAITNLGPCGVWEPPSPRQPGWHKDGWHFRHFLDSPEQGLLAVPFYSDVRSKAGATVIATDSVAVVARFLAAHPEGVHPDALQAGGHLVPVLMDQCHEFDELTGSAGDLALVHPFVLHRAVPNPTGRVRIIANIPIGLNDPMCFDRPVGAYSMVEQAVLAALEVDRLDYAPTRPRELVTPFPMRDDEALRREGRALSEEMVAHARTGTVSPGWATKAGYLSNREATSSS